MTGDYAQVVTDAANAAHLLNDSPSAPGRPAQDAPPETPPLAPYVWKPPRDPWPDLATIDRLAAIEDRDTALLVCAAFKADGNIDEEEYNMAIEAVEHANARREREPVEAADREELEAEDREERAAQIDAELCALDDALSLYADNPLSGAERAALLWKRHELEKRLYAPNPEETA